MATRKISFIFLIVFCCSFSVFSQVKFSEIAWMGTQHSTYDEWIELYNNSDNDIDLTNWLIEAEDGTPHIVLSGVIKAHGYFLLERTDDTSVPDVAADLIYTGALENGGEKLYLKDNAGNVSDYVDKWYAGDSTSKATMYRKDFSIEGTDPNAWETSTEEYAVGLGTPTNSQQSSSLVKPDWLSAYLSNHLETTMPSYGPKDMERVLVNLLNSAHTSIYFAIYGYSSCPTVLQALKNAIDRGVDVKGVVDCYADGWFPYPDTQTLINALPQGSIVADFDDRTMHNKFFVVDGEYVWTGSTNISLTGIDTEYNSNFSVLIHNSDLANAYETEFFEMFNGAFHDSKTDNTPHRFVMDDNSVVECYFAPTDNARDNAIIKAINHSTKTIDIRIFFFTDTAIADALIDAKNRGVQIRVILDATGAESEYSQHNRLRDAGIQVKVENWGGKEHFKAMCVDNKVVVMGSQNWTGSGNWSNDENTLYIENAYLARQFEQDFEKAWDSIPDIYLTEDPAPESQESIGSLSDFLDNDHDGLVDEGAPEELNNVSEELGAINVYFNKGGVATVASTGNVLNQHVNLENRLIKRINQAQYSLDIATYDIDLPALVDAIIQAKVRGVNVRVIADSKDYLPGESRTYDLHCISIEKLIRGADGVVGTSDDIPVFSDSPIFAVEDSSKRQQYGLPANPDGFPYVTVTVGTKDRTGYMLCEGEKKSNGNYYSPGDQMHNKFVIVDEKWVWTGSWNFTINGLYGSENNMNSGILGGNTNNAVELYSTGIAQAYTLEFEEMWGSSTQIPDPDNSNFHGRKTDNTRHLFNLNGTTVEVYFAPGDNPLSKLQDTIANDADYNAYFCIFAWSDQTMCDELKYKYEGSYDDMVGTLTGFDIAGVFEHLYWNQWWSASVDMTGRTASKTSDNNPNIRWANPAPVYKDNEDTMMHHKYMILDVNTDSDPIVITGSLNWSANGNDSNDENVLIIHNANIANQYYQEFLGRYFQAGGNIKKYIDPTTSVNMPVPNIERISKK
ncbi:conserved hypothetical protein [Thermotomaculum hydrothermale]|uniref:phospholipase D n=1 Tax=Thermotomaculum hydrothermale TaxID=981385 RepID=A0A7R6SYE5_9BACT|nr:phospholipase D-like domain-containing protein [Thermotomaculum hydrothermale]BBB32476.1 conserved hypothetical protein [Thermotomaculum hydrothermale]